MGDPDNSGSDRITADVLVLGGIVVIMDERHTILTDGALAIRGNSILALGPRAQIAAAYSAATIVEATGCLVIPGLIDAHTHIPMTLFRGLADDLPLHTWLEQQCGRRSIDSSTPKLSGGGAASVSPNYCVRV
jgi:cytosine/adenosine deaminase-related metal-dependent hydrolase